MRFPSVSKAEWVAIAVIVAVLVALVPPTPHWRDLTYESCDLCGNCRATIRDYRWWRLASETVEPVEEFPIPERHVHDWWTYSTSHDSYCRSWVACRVVRYRDGRIMWKP